MRKFLKKNVVVKQMDCFDCFFLSIIMIIKIYFAFGNHKNKFHQNNTFFNNNDHKANLSILLQLVILNFLMIFH